ncbi:hypothetical protein ISP14_00690 [Dyella agri]|uniref:Glycine zipper domain-containing protein n=2 Tax=Dyella agri TaxID=1926869 RepID=A0ABW8KBK2_9GAMM
MGGLGKPDATAAAPGASTQSTATHECNPVVTGAIGALAGSLFGNGKGHLAGAAIGAGVGVFACMAYNYHSRRVRDARAVEAQYQSQRGALPATNTIDSYQSALVPGGTVQSGGKVEMQSHVTLLRGAHDVPPQLKEQLTLYSPDGKQLATSTKDVDAINGTGEYETSFDFNLPKGIQEGRYTMSSTLYMGGQKVRTNEVPMLVVS